MRKGCQISKNSEGRKWIQRATGLQNFLPFKEKDCGREPSHTAQRCVRLPWAEQKAELLQSQKSERQITENCSQTLKNNGIYLARFQICLGLVTTLFLLIFIFWNENL